MNIAEDLYAEEFEETDLNIIEEAGDQAQDQENIEDPVQNDEENESAKKQEVKPKRAVRNPQPKLNAETLRGKRGLPAIESYFERVKYKGQGHEEQDLSVILKTYEYWCHRLFPKYPFDECISKLEKLGTKRAVVTQIKKIRVDLYDDYEPTVNDINEDNDAVMENPNSQLGEIASNNQQFEKFSNNQFDDLFDDTPLPEPTVEFTEEQIEQIRLNKERAEKRREEKLRRKRELAESFVAMNENEREYSIRDLAPNKTAPLMEPAESVIAGSSFRIDGDNREYASKETSQTEIVPSREVAELYVTVNENHTRNSIEEILQTDDNSSLNKFADSSVEVNIDNSETLTEETPQTLEL